MRHNVYLNDNKKRNLYKKMEIIQKVLKAFGFYIKQNFFISLILNRFDFNDTLKKNSFKTRIKNYCIVTGRGRGVYKKVRVSRILLRVLGAEGLFFGLKKSSW